jgi:hypothetical protein
MTPETDVAGSKSTFDVTVAVEPDGALTMSASPAGSLTMNVSFARRVGMGMLGWSCVRPSPKAGAYWL